MKTVVISNLDPNQVMDIVRELRQQGMTQGKDFDFAYYKAEWDNFSGDAVTPQHTKFMFYNDQLATWFQLKYS